MNSVMTTKLSSKGQVVMPEPVRNMFGWDVGTAFTVMVYNGAVILKPIVAPSQAELEDEFSSAFNESRVSAKAAKLSRKSIDDAISAVRSSRRQLRSAI